LTQTGTAFPMRYWWVNQNQTYRQELGGGYLWSPKRNANGARNPFYESMREVAPGDIVFSFVDTRIAAAGIAAVPPSTGRWRKLVANKFGSPNITRTYNPSVNTRRL